jgi:hypothetical protein
MRTMRLCSTQSHSRLCELPEVPKFFCSQTAKPKDQSQAVNCAGTSSVASRNATATLFGFALVGLIAIKLEKPLVESIPNS